MPLHWPRGTLLGLRLPSSLGQSHASAYRRSLAVSSTTISHSLYVVILGVCLRFKSHWIFQIYKYVIKGREELTSCSSLIHSHMFPLLDVLYRQVGNLPFGQWRVLNFVMATSNHIVAAIQGARNISVRFRAYLSIWSIIPTGNKQAMLSAGCQRLVKGSLIGRPFDARHPRYLAI